METINFNIVNRESWGSKVSTSALRAPWDPSLPLSRMEHGAQVSHLLCNIILGVLRWSWVGNFHFVSINGDSHPAICWEACVNMECPANALLAVAAIFITTAVFVGPCVPGGLSETSTIVFNDVHLHALWTSVWLNITVSTATIRRSSIEVVIDTTMRTGYIHIKLNIST